MSHDYNELATHFARIEEHKNVANDHLKHLHAAIREAGVIVAGGEVPSEEKMEAIYQHSSSVSYAMGSVEGITALILSDFHHPTPADIEHDIAEQRWEENRDLSAVHE